MQLYKFTINEIDVTSEVLSGTEIILSQRNKTGNTSNINLRNNILTLIPDLSIGMEILIQRGSLSSTETKVFKGNIKTIVNSVDKITLLCFDPIQQLTHLYFTTSYDREIDTQAGEVSAIAQDIIENGGFEASVVDSGSANVDVTLKKFISKDQSRINRLNALGEIIDYLFYYDYENDWIRFEPINTTSYTTPLIVGTNVYNVPVWEEDLESVRNKITVKGAYEEDTREQTFNGDNSETAFTLLSEPVITEVYVGGVLQIKGVENSTENYDYTMDSTLKRIEFVVAPTTGTGNVIIKYTTRIPAPATSIDPTSVALYGLTQEEIYTFDDIVSVEDAESRVQALLTKFAFATATTTLDVDAFDIKPGMLVTVTDSSNPQRNGEYSVQKLIMKYPSATDLIEIGDIQLDTGEIIESVQSRLRAIEEKDSQLTQLLRQLIGLSKTYNYQRRYLEVEIKTVGEPYMIWGHPDYGTWGEDEWGINPNPRRDLVRVQQNNNYQEYLYDEDFKDSSSTGTWNTTTQEITLTAGEFILTDKVMEGPIPNYFTVTVPNSTGTFTTEISGDDGATWQTVTLGQRTPFDTVDDMGVRLKITNVSAGGSFPTPFGTWGGEGSETVTISNTYTVYEEHTQPSINLILEE